MSRAGWRTPAGAAIYPVSDQTAANRRCRGGHPDGRIARSTADSPRGAARAPCVSRPPLGRAIRRSIGRAGVTRLDPLRRRMLVDGAIVAGAIVAAAALWAIGDRTAASLLASATAMAGAAAVLLLGRHHAVLAVAIVFALASASRLVLETPVGSLRLEQPAIGALVVVAAARVWREGVHAPRQVWLIGASVVIYLAALAMSSALFAPQPIASLRMTLWWAISASGGVAAFVLLRGRALAGRDAFISVGSGFAVIGIVAAVIFGIAGPEIAPGIQEVQSVQPRVYGLGWEVNLYASYLAAILILAVGAAGGRRWILLGAVALLGIAFPLGETRGAYLGLVAGAISMGAILAWRARRGTFRASRSLVSTVGVGAVSLAVGLVCVTLLLPNNDERLERGLSAARPSPTLTATPSRTAAPTPIGTGAPTAGTTPVPTPAQTSEPTPEAAPSARPTLVPAEDTIGFRLARVEPALDDLRHSPVIGLGASSFGQRHADPSQGGAPDHLAILILAVPYESGLVGTAALLLALLLILGGLIAQVRGTRAVLAASLLGAIVSLLVAYQATNALHFATNWLLLGLATAVAWGQEKAPTAEQP